MSISSRITSIEEHLKESYQELEGIGIDTTGVNNNLENIPKLLDGYWETLPKVTDEGTSITLDNTKEGKMKVLLKGNTYQETTTQSANLFDEDYYNNDSLYSINTYKYTKLKRIKERGTLYFKAQLKTGKSEIGSFYLSLCSKVNPNTRPNNAAWAIYGTIVQDGSQYQNNYATFDEIDDLYFTFYPTTVAVNTIFDTYDFLISTDNISYVPFVPDSPNPDYPQDIHTVSGDNTIVSTGKNLFDVKGYLEDRGVPYTENSDGSITFNTSQILYAQPFEFGDIGKVSLQAQITNNTTSNFRISLLNASGTSQGSVTESSSNLQNKTATKLRFDWSSVGQVTIKNVMLNKGETIETYEPFGKKYQVNLPIENILPINQITSQTINGLTITNLEDGTIKVNGTSNATTRLDVTYPKTLKANTTYTWHNFNTRANANANVNIQDSSSNVLSNITLNNSSGTYTPTTNVSIAKMRFYIDSNQTFDNYILKVQLEEGTKQNSFAPYGTTPIELCKIGTYQDRFIRTRGKNLVDILNGTIVKRESATYTNINRTANTLSYNITTTVAGYLGFVIPIEIGKQYTLSFDRTSGYIYTIELDNMITEVGTNYGSPRTSGYSFTATKPYIGIWAIANTDGGSYASISNLILNEGTTALPYEPYGTNEWYLHKEIGKVVLDGSESWLKLQISSTGKYYFKIEPSYNQQTTNGKLLYSDYFLPNNTWSEQAIGMWFDRNLIVKTQGSLNNTETANDFKTWLGTHNTILYYVLATPTYTKIEGTLKDQLNALSGAKSYNSQTNISQENNDNASIMSAVALSE